MKIEEKIIYDEIMDLLLYNHVEHIESGKIEETAKRILMLLKMEDEKYRE